MAEIATKPPRKPFFTKRNAKAMSRKAVAIRQSNSATAKVHRSTIKQEEDYHVFVRGYVARLQCHLYRFDLLLSEATSGGKFLGRLNTVDVVSRAAERMFGIWAHLTQTPAPGQLRPEKMKKLLREYGMKSAIANAMSQAPDPTPNASPIPTPDAAPNPGDLSPQNLTPIPASESPAETMPNVTLESSTIASTSDNVTQDKESLNSQAGPVPTPDTPTRDWMRSGIR